MDILYEQQEASASDVQARMHDDLAYSSVRTFLRKLEEKGQVNHREDGNRYIYRPIVAKTAASESALDRLVRTFFDGSASQAVAGLLGNAAVSDAELDEIEALIARRREGARAAAKSGDADDAASGAAGSDQGGGRD